jgi:hypothetical protein
MSVQVSYKKQTIFGICILLIIFSSLEFGARFYDLQEVQVSMDGTNFVTVGDNMSYSQLMDQLKKADITINRKMLADLAVNNAENFTAIVNSIASQK